MPRRPGIVVLVLGFAGIPNLVSPLRAEEAVSVVSPVEAARARAEVRHECRSGENGVLVHTFTFPDGVVVRFPDRPRRPTDTPSRPRVVAYVGTEAAAREPESTFSAAGQSAGLSPEAIEALRFVSRHEGGFDAINTWDRARFSWGFIQFAGGYGFPPMLAHFKRISPELFRRLLGRYGIDLTEDAGRAEPVYVGTETGVTLRGAAAEQRYGDDPLVIALFVRAGRVTEVKQRQVEAAIRDYVRPALAAAFEGQRISSVLQSPQGLAMLIDRMVHEGSVVRLEAALEHARVLNDAAPPAWPFLEGEVLDMALRDADARALLVERVDRAITALEERATSLPAGEEGRSALEAALYQARYRMSVSALRDRLVNAVSDALVRVSSPASAMPADSGDAARIAVDLRALTGRMRYERGIWARLRDIRDGGLDGPPRVALLIP